MNQRLNTFNIACLTLSGCFIIATAYLWRGALVNAAVDNTIQNIPTVTRQEIQESNKNEIKIKDQKTEENLNLDLNSSTQQETETTTKEPLPTEINLDVPFTSQAPEKNWDQPWQDACEEAALLMLDAYYKDYQLSPLFARDEILKLVEWEETQGWGGSIEIEKVKEVASTQVLKFASERLRIIEDPTVDDIKQSIAAGNPVLAVADGKVLPNKFFQNGGPVYHALIIRGYTDTHFITNDPGTQFGENYTYTYDELMNAIHDWNGGDVPNGKKAVLVVN